MLMPLARAARGAFVALIVTLAVTAPGAAPARAEKAMMTAQEFRELAQAAADTARAGWAVGELRRHLATTRDSAMIPLLRANLVQALANSHAPGTAIADAADSLRDLPGGPAAEVQLLLGVAQLLSVRREALDRASALADRAVRTVPLDAEWDALRGMALNAHGTLEAQRGEYALAIAPLTRALSFHADSQGTLFALGHAYEQLGRNDEAIDAYIRSLAVFGGQDLRAQDPLRALFTRQHGSLDSLEPRLERSREASRHHIAIESRRDERPAPAWTLANFAGDSVAGRAHQGRVAVYNFWGSWCGPCRRELPYFQSMYHRFKDRGVEFVGMNWERVADPAERVRLAKGFMAENRLDFPVALDHDQAVGRAFGVTAYPTVLVLDKRGRIRFKNVGFNPQIDEIMTAQIEALLAE